MAKLLIEQLAGDFEAEDYEDDYALAVQALVKAKVEGGEVQAPAVEAEESGEVVDLLAALAKSVEKAKASRGEAPSESKPAAKKAASKSASKSAEKKPAKKTAAKKSASKTTKKATKKAS